MLEFYPLSLRQLDFRLISCAIRWSTLQRASFTQLILLFGLGQPRPHIRPQEQNDQQQAEDWRQGEQRESAQIDRCGISQGNANRQLKPTGS